MDQTGCVEKSGKMSSLQIWNACQIRRYKDTQPRTRSYVSIFYIMGIYGASGPFLVTISVVNCQFSSRHFIRGGGKKALYKMTIWKYYFNLHCEIFTLIWVCFRSLIRALNKNQSKIPFPVAQTVPDELKSLEIKLATMAICHTSIRKLFDPKVKLNLQDCFLIFFTFHLNLVY